MSFNLSEAKRSKAKLRLTIDGPSGSGKTYSALLIAYGLCGDWSKIAVIDTERESANLYADLCSDGKKISDRADKRTVYPSEIPRSPQSLRERGHGSVIIRLFNSCVDSRGGMLTFITTQ